MKGWIFPRVGNPQDVGLWGERRAKRCLRKKGFTILGHRVRLGKDELDLVARDQDVLVFIEVKTRTSEAYGRPADAVGYKKQQALSRAAARYLARLKQKPPFIRFDIVEVVKVPGKETVVRHIPAAFNATSHYDLTWS